MGLDIATPVMVDDAVNDVLKLIKKRGFRIEPNAEDELRDLVMQGFRALAASRVLDLPGPEQTRAVTRARANLDEFMEVWMRADSRTGDKVLTTVGMQSAQSEFCPVFPM